MVDGECASSSSPLSLLKIETHSHFPGLLVLGYQPWYSYHWVPWFVSEVIQDEKVNTQQVMCTSDSIPSNNQIQMFSRRRTTYKNGAKRQSAHVRVSCHLHRPIVIASLSALFPSQHHVPWQNLICQFVQLKYTNACSRPCDATALTIMPIGYPRSSAKPRGIKKELECRSARTRTQQARKRPARQNPRLPSHQG